MTRYNWMVKWSVYGAGLLFVLLFQLLVTDRILIFGVRPILIPLAVVVVAAFEGSSGGAGFGLFAGILSYAAFYDGGIFSVFLLSALGLITGLLADFLFRRTLLCVLVCSLGYLGLFELWNVLPRLFAGVPLSALLQVALPEFFYSLAPLILLYALFRCVFRRVGGNWGE